MATQSVALNEPAIASEDFSFTQITTNSPCETSFGPSLSADGKRIAFVTQTAFCPVGENFLQLDLFDSANGLTKVASSDGTCFIHTDAPGTNADGTRITFYSSCDFVGANPNLQSQNYLFDTVPNSFSQFSTGICSQFNPAINADGTRFALLSCTVSVDADGNGVLSLPKMVLLDGPSGKLTAVTAECSSNYSPTLNAAGTRLAFLSSCDLTGGNVDKNQELFQFDSSSGLKQITTSSHCRSYGPRLNADGTRMAFYSNCDFANGNADGNYEIYVFDSAVGFIQVTSTPNHCFNSDPAINGAGNRVAFASNCDLTGSNDASNGGIYIFDISGGIIPITANSGGADSPAIDATGNRVAFRSSRDITGDNAQHSSQIFSAAPPNACAGDCNGGSDVTIDELIRGTKIVLGAAPLDSCRSLDLNRDGQVTIDELVVAVHNALAGCPSEV